jgi:hypothetical protein
MAPPRVITVKSHTIESLVQALVAARLDATKSRAFAVALMREVAGYKPSHVSALRMRKDMMRIANSWDGAISALDQATDRRFHWDSTDYLWTYASHSGPLDIQLTKSRAWSSTVKKYWPHIDRLPPLEAMREYLVVYARQARRSANHLPSPKRGSQHDFERYRPVLYCVRAWRHSFGTKPGKGMTSPFVRACAVALPLFGLEVPSKLHTFVQRALKGLDLDRLK